MIQFDAGCVLPTGPRHVLRPDRATRLTTCHSLGTVECPRAGLGSRRVTRKTQNSTMIGQILPEDEETLPTRKLIRFAQFSWGASRHVNPIMQLGDFRRLIWSGRVKALKIV